MEDLLKEAKRKYPIGTKFIQAHKKTNGTIITVKGNWSIYGEGHIIVETEESSPWVPLIYYSSAKIWAEIVNNTNYEIY